MNAPQPIETEYGGYRFRSRLEARWAVFFTEAKIPFQYEAEGYDLGELGWYLPDFWLPAPLEMLVEVKAGDLRPRTNFDEQWVTGVMTEVRNQTTSPEFVAKFKETWAEPREQTLARALARLKGPPVRVAVVYGDPVEAHATAGNLVFAPDGQCDGWRYTFRNYETDEAAKLARHARFEHGEQGGRDYERPSSALLASLRRLEQMKR